MPTDSASTDFTVKVHAAERVIEVVYPPRPTAESFERYERDVRAAIERMGAPWKCLVDQRALTVAVKEMASRIQGLNAWAVTSGMQRSVRVVNDTAIAELQATRILRETGFDSEKGVFHSREEAWVALVGG